MQNLNFWIMLLDVVTFLLALCSALLIWFYPKSWAQKMPSPILALILGTLIVALFDLPVETIGTRFGGIPQGLPSFDLPEFTFASLGHLIAPAMTIALLGAIESLLSAAVADGMIDDKHDPNQELIAQGIANIVTPFFGGLPATGAIARTAANVRSVLGRFTATVSAHSSGKRNLLLKPRRICVSGVTFRP